MFKAILKLTICLAACFAVSAIGALFTTRESITIWYASLQKPFFTPPNWLFGPVWGILYLMMAVSAFLIWNRGINQPNVKQALGFFVIQLGLNAIWTPLFFGFHLVALSFLEIVLLWIMIMITYIKFKRIYPIAAFMLLPYLVWVGYAAALNGSIFYLNQASAISQAQRNKQAVDPNSKKVKEVKTMKSNQNNKKLNKLTKQEEAIIIYKGTEAPFTGKYYKFNEKGTYTCKRCNAELFRSGDKFDSECGWPSFDNAIPGAVKFVPDKDGIRTEIICNNCGAHLGHIFKGENFTPKNTRYCINSISMNFVPAKKEPVLEKAYFAGGCFWGVEFLFKDVNGVISTKVGYMGGTKPNPTYREVSSGTTGHAETLQVTFDPNKTSFEALAKLFFEIHDSTQVNRQGPDIGLQYRSAIFYVNDAQKQTAEKLVQILKDKGCKVATQLAKADKFWPAEDYHQQYYQKNGKLPYCHAYIKRF